MRRAGLRLYHACVQRVHAGFAMHSNSLQQFKKTELACALEYRICCTLVSSCDSKRGSSGDNAKSTRHLT
eukprot:18193-Heterococcus_DN1.PRE.2